MQTKQVPVADVSQNEEQAIRCLVDTCSQRLGHRQRRESISDQPVGQRISMLIARLCFRGIYFPQMGRWVWTKVIVQNRQTIYDLAKEGVVTGAPGDGIVL